MIAVQGPNARANAVAGAARQRSATAALEAVQRGVRRRRDGASVHRAHRLHRRGRLRDRAAGDRSRGAVARAGRRGRAALRARRARHAAPRSRHEPLRPGHGRDGVAARVGPRLDRRSRERRAISSARRRSLATPPARQLVGLVLLDGGRRAARAPERATPAAATARSPAARSRPTLSKSIALARLPAGVRRGDTVHVDVRDKRARRARRQAAVRAQRQECSSR